MKALRRWRRRRAEAFVRALFQTFLRQEPEPEMLDVWVDSVLKRGLASAYAPSIEAFMEADAASTVAARRLPFLYERGGVKTVDAIVSLGTHCYTSSVLKGAGLKQFSTPFDWLSSSPSMVAHCIEDDFRTLLDRRFYEPVADKGAILANGGEICEHRFYREHHGATNVFVHHNPMTERDYDYLQRCASRFASVLRSPGPTLFVLCTRATANVDAELEAVEAALRPRMRDEAELLFIVVGEKRDDILTPRLDVLRAGSNSRWLRMTPTSSWDALRFHSTVDDLAILSVLRRYRLTTARPG